MSQSRLYRETSNQVIGGVCSGLGSYLNIDPVIVRIIFVLLAILGGGGLIIYILLWIFVPGRDQNTYYQNAEENMEQPPSNEEQQPQPAMDPSRGSLLAGLILITFGAIFLADRFVPAIDFADLWPLLLIVAGVLLLKNHFTNDKNEEQ